MSGTKLLPLIGIPACHVDEDGRAIHRVVEKYIDAVFDGSDCMAVLVPAYGGRLDFSTLLERLDGLFLTGGASNVEPHHYHGTPSRPGTKHDPRRDNTVLPLIRGAVAAGIPVFAVCRGIQELNVALGGTLHQLVHELPGKNEHRMDRALPPEERYRERHLVTLSEGGLLQRLAGGVSDVMVNSLHAQAIDRPAAGLFVEAVSDDGVIEAVTMPAAKGFVLGVQWHPEHPIPRRWPLSTAMFDAFGDAARAYAATRMPSTDVRAA